jgi:aspartate carbamoyltransferase catalytic subunit
LRNSTRPYAHSGDRERPIQLIVNTGSGDHEHPIALA